MSLGFHPKISLPTRLGNNSHALIANIFTTNKDVDECSDTLLCDISDYFPVSVLTKLLLWREKQLHKYITIANNSAIAFNNFQMKSINKSYTFGFIILLIVM